MLGKVSGGGKTLVLSLLAAFLLSACGGGSGGSSSNSKQEEINKTGVLIDNIVSGVKYVNKNNTDFTDSNGEFTYKGGKIEFFLGGIKLGEVNFLPADNKVFVQDLLKLDRKNTSDAKLLILSKLLQSIDSVPFTDEIEISQENFDKFNDINQNLQDLNLTTLLPSLGFSVKSDEEVQKHLKRTLVHYDVIKDTQAPTLSSSTQTFTTTVGTPLTLPTVTATDDIDKSVEVEKEGIVDFDTAGTYTITYTATDSAGNSSSITHTYIVQDIVVSDTQAPTLSHGSQTFTTTVGTPLTLPIVTATDNVDGNVNVVQNGSVDFNIVGTYTITYTATDSAGNTSTITHTYIVQDIVVSDTQAPTLSHGNQTFTTTVGTPLTLPIVTATDNVDGNVNVTKTGTVDFNTVGTYTITYTATDSAGNSSSITHTYVVQVADTQAPILSHVTRTFTTTVGTPLTLPTVTATDNIDGNVNVVQNGSVDFNTAGTYIITYSATDSAGNTSSITHTYIVNEPPVATITHNGFTYEIVTSPITGKQWLDRNLGATQVCTKSRDDVSFSNDSEYVEDQKDCFGDLYQWGRLSDGHEKINYIDQTQNQSIDYDPSLTIDDNGIIKTTGADSDKFIKSPNDPHDWTDKDEDGSKRKAVWEKTDGTSICPSGFRVPTIDELKAETIEWSDPTMTEDESTGKLKVTNRDTAFKNFLKFPVSGFRYSDDASLDDQGGGGFVWSSSSPDGSNEQYIYFYDVTADDYWGYRAVGFSVRCLKD